MRGRMWRRYRRECYHIKRMKRCVNFYWTSVIDVNFIIIKKPLWSDLISTQHFYILRDTKTRKYDSYVKTKWGKSGKKNYDYSSDRNTRVKDKIRFFKELREYGYL
jgi:hypothetical protein